MSTLFALRLRLRHCFILLSVTLRQTKIEKLMTMQTHFGPLIHADVIGVEICGSLKNVLAIAAGIVEGLELGPNAMAALVAQVWMRCIWHWFWMCCHLLLEQMRGMQTSRHIGCAAPLLTGHSSLCALHHLCLSSCWCRAALRSGGLQQRWGLRQQLSAVSQVSMCSSCISCFCFN